MASLNFQNAYFREHLLMAAFIRFRSTCFSEHLKVDAFFIKQPCYFFLGIFLIKESPKKAHTFILNSMMRDISIIVSHHVFIIFFFFYAVTHQKLLFTDETGTRKIAPRGLPTLTLTTTLILTQGGICWREVGGSVAVFPRAIF